VAEDPWPDLSTPQFRDQQVLFRRLIDGSAMPKHINSWRALQGKLGRLRRLRVFDSREVSGLPYTRMAQPGIVSIIDLSGTDAPEVKNLAIAELLRGVQDYQEGMARQAEREGTPLTPVMVFIEEAHEFLSAERIRQMPVLFGQVQRIARRGRKRWLGLVFVTQLPQHLPDQEPVLLLTAAAGTKQKGGGGGHRRPEDDDGRTPQDGQEGRRRQA
jgi:hypothetical protein